MHTPTLTNLAAPAIEKVTPAVEQIRPALGHALDQARDHVPSHLPDQLTGHLPSLPSLPDQLTSHLPGRKRCGTTARARRFAREHRTGLLLVGLAAVAGGAAGWFAMRRGAAPGWAPTHSTEAATSTSGYAQPDRAATGAPGSDGGYADRGADDGFGGAAIGGTAEVSEGPFGAGSADPMQDGSAPGAAYTIKGDLGAKTFYTRESPDYEAAPAGVWFSDVATAREAGFTAWDDK